MLDRRPVEEKIREVMRMRVRLIVSGLIVRRFGLWQGYGEGASMARGAGDGDISSMRPGYGPGQAETQTEAGF